MFMWIDDIVKLVHSLMLMWMGNILKLVHC